jgi:hypothetical protein
MTGLRDKVAGKALFLAMSLEVFPEEMTLESMD